MSYDPARLMADARTALQRAHAPYSNFPVGAALVTKDGRVHTGVNVENASLGLSVCAERNAIFSAIAQGDHDFAGIAIATTADSPTPPCGACRQVMLEFCDDLPIHIAVPGGEIETHTLLELTPRPFRSYRRTPR